MTFDPNLNPRYPVEKEPMGGQGGYQSMTADLAWNYYGCSVAWLGKPRDVIVVATSPSGGTMQLVEDMHTGRWFMTQKGRKGIVQYSTGDAHYFQTLK